MWNYKVTDNSPEGNGQCERFNKTMPGMLRTLSETQKSEWRDHLLKLIFAYNSTRHESMGFSPYYLPFGRNPQLPVGIIFDNTFPSKARTHQQHIEEWQRAMNQAREIATQKVRKARTQCKLYYDQKVRSSVLNQVIEDYSETCHNVEDQASFVLIAWENDVYVIKKRRSEDSPVYCIAPESKNEKERTVYRNLLLPFPYLISDKSTDKKATSKKGKPQTRNHRRDSLKEANIDCYDSDMSEDLPDVFTLSSPAIHKKKVDVSTDDVSPVPPVDDSLLIHQTIMDEEPGTSPLEKKDSEPTPEVPEGNVAVRSDQPESKEPQPSNDQSCHPPQQHCPPVRLAYDSLG